MSCHDTCLGHVVTQLQKSSISLYSQLKTTIDLTLYLWRHRLQQAFQLNSLLLVIGMRFVFVADTLVGFEYKGKKLFLNLHSCYSGFTCCQLQSQKVDTKMIPLRIAFVFLVSHIFAIMPHLHLEADRCSNLQNKN